MLKVKNTGKKVIHIGKKALMPKEEVTVSEKVASTPAIKILAKHGNLEISEVKEAEAKEAKEEAVAAAPAAEKKAAVKKAPEAAKTEK
ncbi:MAG: hypothetical protein LUD12_10255 [Lachnospiraceae bacterium]|nr:hypothetical protein [Lachnospiraceae bacterium]